MTDGRGGRCPVPAVHCSGAQATELGRSAIEEGRDPLLEVGPTEALDHQLDRTAARRRRARRAARCTPAVHHRHRRRRGLAGQVADVVLGGRQHFVRRSARLTRPIGAPRTADLAGREEQVEGVRRDRRAGQRPGEPPLGDGPAPRMTSSGLRGLMNRRSQERAIAPPQATGPLMAAMIGFGTESATSTCRAGRRPRTRRGGAPSGPVNRAGRRLWRAGQWSR